MDYEEPRICKEKIDECEGQLRTSSFMLSGKSNFWPSHFDADGLPKMQTY
jgi:hypothetical protein